jgi:hypothetical protein
MKQSLSELSMKSEKSVLHSFGTLHGEPKKLAIQIILDGFYFLCL